MGIWFPSEALYEDENATLNLNFCKFKTATYDNWIVK